jgi:hypothetical protein
MIFLDGVQITDKGVSSLTSLKKTRKAAAARHANHWCGPEAPEST